MGKRKDDRSRSDTRASGEPRNIGSPSGQDVTSAATVAILDTPAAPTPSVEPTAATPASVPEIPSPTIAALDTPKPSPAIAERLNARLDAMRARGRAAVAAPAAAVAGWWRAQVECLTPFAASIAIAAAVGALTGSIATMVFDAVRARAQAAQTADAQPMQDAIARINTDLVSLKAAVDTSGRSSNSRLVKLSDRLDHVEHGQAEPAARVATTGDALDRAERRAAAPQNAANDVTGSIASVAPASIPSAAPSARPESPPVLGGWVVRGVYSGVALIQGRMGSLVEVEPGDYLPGLGRIDAIRRQDGHWVVVTNKGVIVAR
jgi:hypothetical protein